MTGLLGIQATALPAEALVARCGTILATFDHRTQDSGNVSWLVDAPDGRFFCKSAGRAEPPPTGAPVPYFDHPRRVELLRNAVEVAASCDHPALAKLRAVIETGTGPILVYDAAPGELVHVPQPQRSDPTSAYLRFANAKTGVRLAVFGQLLNAHAALAEAGWVACDLYDGCLLVDGDRLTLVDLDTYHRGPFVNTMGRMFGSTTFMAPEEFVHGARIDLRTTVFTLGRLLWHFGTGASEEADDFCGAPGQADVVRRACAAAPADRWPDPGALDAAWRSAG